MARFYGTYLAQKKVLNRTVLSWLEQLPDDFDIFIEVEGGDFQVDFLVFKPTGIFNIEAKKWPVKEVRLDAPWTLEDSSTKADPFTTQVLDQCVKVKDYILFQRHRIFPKQKADLFWDKRDQLRIFPVVALSAPSPYLTRATHQYRRVVVSARELKNHLQRFVWEHEITDRFRQLRIERAEVRKLAELLHLPEIDVRTLRPKAIAVARRAAEMPRPAAPVAPTLGPPGEVLENPYQYTACVVGSDFYGRETELSRLRLALMMLPPKHVAIAGLQRTGKSSLAKEAIRRFTASSQAYTALELDFRELKHEGLKPEEDLTLRLLGRLTAESAGSQVGQDIEDYRAKAIKSQVGDQRRFFKQALTKNRERGKRTILFLDECHEIEEFLGDAKVRSFFFFLDSLCKDAELNLHVILACQPRFFELAPIKELNLGRLFDAATLGPLEERAATDVVSRGERILEFFESAKEHVLKLTGCHAFWVQYLCHKLFESALLTDNFSVTVERIDELIESLIRDPGTAPQFYVLYQGIERHPDALTLLKEVAHKAAASFAAVALHDLSPPWHEESVLRSGLKPLVDYQILALEKAPEHPQVRFCAEALRRWMRPNLLTI